MHLAGTGLIAIDGIFRYLLRGQRILTLSGNLLANMANGRYCYDDFSHVFLSFKIRLTTLLFVISPSKKKTPILTMRQKEGLKGFCPVREDRSLL